MFADIIITARFYLADQPMLVIQGYITSCQADIEIFYRAFTCRGCFRHIAFCSLKKFILFSYLRRPFHDLVEKLKYSNSNSIDNLQITSRIWIGCKKLLVWIQVSRQCTRVYKCSCYFYLTRIFDFLVFTVVRRQIWQQSSTTKWLVFLNFRRRKYSIFSLHPLNSHKIS